MTVGVDHAAMTKSLRCLMRWHRFKVAFSPEGDKYLKCTRCAAEDDDHSRVRAVGGA
jgi:hypothetical protein